MLQLLLLLLLRAWQVVIKICTWLTRNYYVKKQTCIKPFYRLVRRFVSLTQNQKGTIRFYIRCVSYLLSSALNVLTVCLSIHHRFSPTCTAYTCNVLNNPNGGIRVYTHVCRVLSFKSRHISVTLCLYACLRVCAAIRA